MYFEHFPFFDICWKPKPEFPTIGNFQVCVHQPPEFSSVVMLGMDFWDF